jgi:hypothetical protein
MGLRRQAMHWRSEWIGSKLPGVNNCPGGGDHSVVLLLLFLYESYGVTIAMLITTLLAVAAVYIGLWITGTEFNITSRMGMTMIVGIVTEVAIFYYSELQELPEQENRFVIAGINRMRPIAMTTFAAILALLPLALGIGQGSAMLKPSRHRNCLRPCLSASAGFGSASLSPRAF